MAKKSFMLHIDSLDILDDLTKEQIADLFIAIKSFQKGEEVLVEGVVKIAFSPFKNQFARDNESYKKTCEARAIAGSLGGKQKVANASKCKQKVANLADSDSKKDKDSKKDNKIDRLKRPTLEEVETYMKEKNFINPKSEAEKFVDFYQSNGWKVGRNSMKCWKSTVRNWGKNDKFGVKVRKPRAEMTNLEKFNTYD